MKYVDEFRDPEACKSVIAEIRSIASKPWILMDVCGGQTHGLVKSGIEQELTDVVQLIHGPGCPVCVTPAEAIDFAIEISMLSGTTVLSFGDMIRVPGSRESLMQSRSKGGQVEVVYSPIDAVVRAERNPEQQFVFFAVGFETTAPASALAVLQAAQRNLTNFSVLVSHVRVLPAMEAMVRMPDTQVDGFLAAGHVTTVTGYGELERFVDEFNVPVVVTGFEPFDLLKGILDCVAQLESGSCHATNQYGRAVKREGNESARSIIDQVYTIATRPWRGFGDITRGGFRMRDQYQRFDAQERFAMSEPPIIEIPTECRAADVLAGKIKPMQCPKFGDACTPLSPLGAPMVSSEGACAAYFRFQSSPS